MSDGTLDRKTRIKPIQAACFGVTPATMLGWFGLLAVKSGTELDGSSILMFAALGFVPTLSVLILNHLVLIRIFTKSQTTAIVFLVISAASMLAVLIDFNFVFAFAGHRGIACCIFVSPPIVISSMLVILTNQMRSHQNSKTFSRAL